MRLRFLLALFLLTSIGYADVVQQPLDQVVYQLIEEDWATTNTANVTIAVNATLNQGNTVDKLQQEVENNLSGIESGTNWHIVSFQQTQNQSGLEQIAIQAQARLPSKSLSNLRERVEKMGKAGQKYQIAQIDFSPTEEDIQHVRTKLRERMYQQVLEEIQTLNKIYPSQSYHVHDLQFEFEQGIVPVRASNVMMAKMDASVAATSMNASQKVIEHAVITLASNGKLDNANHS